MIIKYDCYFYQVFPPNGVETSNQSVRFAKEVIAHIKDYLSKGQEPVSIAYSGCGFTDSGDLTAKQVLITDDLNEFKNLYIKKICQQE